MAPVVSNRSFEVSVLDHARKNPRKRVPFSLPRKLGSDRLLLVSKALDGSPRYRRHAALMKRPRDVSSPLERRVHFSKDGNLTKVEETVHRYDRCYDESDYPNLWFSTGEIALIFDRDDDNFAVCFNDMKHIKQILHLWGMCSRETDVAEITAAAHKLVVGEAPIHNARGLEERIITGIRNHREKAIQSLLQAASNKAEDICERYLSFSQTAQRFSQALAEGDAFAVRLAQQQEGGFIR